MAKMKVNEFLNRTKDLLNYKTIYAVGGIGQPLSAYTKNRLITRHHQNSRADRATAIRQASSDTFAFDCVCMIKSILWGWNGDVDKYLGGAIYESNNVPDCTIWAMAHDDEVQLSQSWGEEPEEGELIYNKEFTHVGVYIGHGQVIECTYRYEDGVQLRKLNEPGRGWKWYYHARCPFVDYTHEQKRKSFEGKLPYLRRYMRSPYVCAWQALLWGTPRTDYFGSETETATIEFQRSHGLIADGIVGEKTWNAMYSSITQR